VDVRVTGHQIDVGDSLRDQAVGRMENIADKYFSRAVAANVTFSPGPQNDFVCDIVAPVSQGIVLKAHHRAQASHIAFEAAADKIERQLRRYANGCASAAVKVPPKSSRAQAIRSSLPRPSQWTRPSTATKERIPQSWRKLVWIFLKLAYRMR
jgi:ribosomal subunit interface protein